MGKQANNQNGDKRRINDRRHNKMPGTNGNRQNQRRQMCVCGSKMNKVKKRFSGISNEELDAYECPNCGRVNIIETDAMRLTRIIALKEQTKKIISLNYSLAVVLPKEFTDAMKLAKGDKVDVSVEGINKIVIRKSI